MRIKTVLLTSTTFLKLSALCVAFFLWSLLSDLYVMSVTYSVPIALKQSSNLVVTNKPEHVDVTLRGLRKYVRAIDPKNLCIAVDTMQLSEGANHIAVTPVMLGLPNVVSVVDYYPMNLTIVAERSGVTHSGQEQDGSSPDASQQPI